MIHCVVIVRYSYVIICTWYCIHYVILRLNICRSINTFHGSAWLHCSRAQQFSHLILMCYLSAHWRSNICQEGGNDRQTEWDSCRGYPLGEWVLSAYLLHLPAMKYKNPQAQEVIQYSVEGLFGRILFFITVHYMKYAQCVALLCFALCYHVLGATNLFMHVFLACCTDMLSPRCPRNNYP